MTSISLHKITFIYCPLFIILYNFTGNLSNDIYLATLPALAQDLVISPLLAQLTMTMWFLGVALPQAIFGFIADRVGYRPLMLWGIVVFVCGTLCCSIAPNIYILLLGRFLQGVGVASLNITTFATVRSHFYDEQSSVKFISWINITGSLAPLIGPVIGSLLFNFFGWRSTFLCILILGVFSLIGLYNFMLEGSDFQNKDTNMSVYSFFDYYKSLLNKNLIIPVITYTCFLAALIAYLTTAPFIIHNQFAISIKYFGLTQIAPFSAFILGGLLVNRLVKYFKLLTLILVGLLISGLAVLFFVLLIGFPQLISIYTYLAAVSLFLFGYAIIGSPLLSLALGSSEQKGGSAAFLGLCMSLMASLASLITALFYNGQFSILCLMMILFISPGILNYLIFCRHSKE